MNFALFSMEGFVFLMRWLHFFFGITWIGHLYYFNFTQGPFFNETDAATKSNAIQKLVPRALWWFRWGAMYTLFTGLAILMTRGHQNGFEIYSSPWGVSILTGVALAFCMWVNVWFVIWPAQKVVIANATATATGGAAIPDAAARGARAGIASRHNVLFSIPMLFFMGAASHLPISMGVDSSLTTWWVVFLAMLAAMQYNAMKGKMGPLASVKGVIHAGFALTAVIYVLMEVIL
jgi:uncharacterized membrane protein